jgi:hemerythrin-like domain-containing protein
VSTRVEVPVANAPVVPRVARNVVDEHRALRALLIQVEEAFGRAMPHAASGPDVVAARLDTLRGPLGAHFEEEERAHLFEEIEELTPEQAPVCARLRDEHSGLIHRLDTLRTASPESRRGSTWVQDVHALLEDLARHEARETDLLTRALDGSTAAVD